MDHIEFRAALEKLWPGHGGQTKAAKYFWPEAFSDAKGHENAKRRLRKYLAGENAVSADIAAEVRDLLAMFPDGMKSVDPVKVISILQSQMIAAGWTSQSASSILGAALANARKHLGDEMTRELLSR